MKPFEPLLHALFIGILFCSYGGINEHVFCSISWREAKAMKKAFIPTRNNISTIGGGGSGGKIGGDVIRMARTWLPSRCNSFHSKSSQTSYHKPHTVILYNQSVFDTRTYGISLWEKKVLTWVWRIYRGKYGYHGWLNYGVISCLVGKQGEKRWELGSVINNILIYSYNTLFEFWVVRGLSLIFLTLLIESWNE